jgi:hypothetical protein
MIPSRDDSTTIREVSPARQGRAGRRRLRRHEIEPDRFRG